MSDLIEKQAIIDALLAKMDTIDDKPEVVLGLAVAAGMIKDMPSALEQDPCEDAISRQAALESIKNLYPDMPIVNIFNAKRKWLEKYAPYFECENAIEQLPSVTSQQKMGRWKPYDGSWYECSECGAIREAVGYFENFCPNCGAKMQEVEE